MLLRIQRLERQLLARFKRRQLVLQFLVLLILAFLRFFVNFEEAVELQYGSSHAEPERFCRRLCVNIDGGLIEDRRCDLGRNESLPDQLVDLELIFF